MTNPLHHVNVTHGEDIMPELQEGIDDIDLIRSVAKEHCLKTHEKQETLIVFTDFTLGSVIEKALSDENIRCIALRRRSDYDSIQSARREGKVVIGYIDFVGGLEFQNVYIVGFDKKRVPPINTTMSFSFFEHIWYRKMYEQ